MVGFGSVWFAPQLFVEEEGMGSRTESREGWSEQRDGGGGQRCTTHQQSANPKTQYGKDDKDKNKRARIKRDRRSETG